MQAGFGQSAHFPTELLITNTQVTQSQSALTARASNAQVRNLPSGQLRGVHVCGSKCDSVLYALRVLGWDFNYRIARKACSRATAGQR